MLFLRKPTRFVLPNTPSPPTLPPPPPPGLTRGKRTVDDVAASFVDRLASDLIDGTLRLDDKTYLNGLMRAYLTNGANLPVTFPSAKFGSSAVGRRLLQADPTATDDLLSFDLEQVREFW